MKLIETLLTLGIIAAPAAAALTALWGSLNVSWIGFTFLILALCATLLLWGISLQGWYPQIFNTRSKTIDEWCDKNKCPPLDASDAKRLGDTLPSQQARFISNLTAAEATLARWYGSQLWGPKAFNFALTFAIAYPLVFLMLTWLVTGIGQVGGVDVLPQLGAGRRALVVAFLCCLSLIAIQITSWSSAINQKLGALSPRWAQALLGTDVLRVVATSVLGIILFTGLNKLLPSNGFFLLLFH